MMLRRFHQKDAIKASNLIKICLREVNSRHHSPRATTALAALNNPSHLIKDAKHHYYIVALANDKLVGICGLDNEKLVRCFVHPKVHNQGIGRALVDRIERYAKSNHLKQIRLNSSLHAVPFYRRLGYSIISSRMMPVDSHEYEAVEMKKIL